jgi:hypothetical protein
MGEGLFMTGKKIDQLDNNGKKGGNSGQLELDIKDKSRGGITFDLEPGRGGEGVAIAIASRVYKPKGQKGTDGVAQQPLGL